MSPPSSLSLPIWEPRERLRSLPSGFGFSPSDIPRSLSWICENRGNLNDEEGEASQEGVGMQNLIQAYEHLKAELQIRKSSCSASPQQLIAWDEQINQLRTLIDSLARTLLPAANVNTQREAKEQDQAKDNGRSCGTQTTDVLAMGASHSGQSGSGSAGDSGSRQSSDFGDVGKSASDCTSVESEAIPGPPTSPETDFGGFRGIGDESVWEMRCTQSLLEAHMRQQHPQVNPDA